jgi:hypothetical protein
MAHLSVIFEPFVFRTVNSGSGFLPLHIWQEWYDSFFYH